MNCSKPKPRFLIFPHNVQAWILSLASLLGILQTGSTLSSRASSDRSRRHDARLYSFGRRTVALLTREAKDVTAIAHRLQASTPTRTLSPRVNHETFLRRVVAPPTSPPIRAHGDGVRTVVRALTSIKTLF